MIMMALPDCMGPHNETTNLRPAKSRERISEESVRLVSVVIPLSVLVTHDLNWNYDAAGAQGVLLADSRVDQLAVRTHGELGGTRQLAVLQDFDFIFAGIGVHLKVHRMKSKSCRTARDRKSTRLNSSH